MEQHVFPKQPYSPDEYRVELARSRRVHAQRKAGIIVAAIILAVIVALLVAHFVFGAFAPVAGGNLSIP